MLAKDNFYKLTLVFICENAIKVVKLISYRNW